MLWETEKLLITSMLSAALWVWKSPKFIIWKTVNPFPNKPWFLRICSTSLLKILWEKEKLLVTSNFTFSHSVFYFHLFPQCFLPFQSTFCHFHFIQNCRLQTLSVWKSLKFVVWKRVKCPIQAFFFLWIYYESNFNYVFIQSCWSIDLLNGVLWPFNFFPKDRI